MNAYIILALAIVAEVIGTTALRYADGFSKFVPAVVVVVGYGAAFYGLSLVLRSIPLGITYAIWAGLGTALTVLTGMVLFKETLNLPQVIGILLIIVGVIMLNYFSHSTV